MPRNPLLFIALVSMDETPLGPTHSMRRKWMAYFTAPSDFIGIHLTSISTMSSVIAGSLAELDYHRQKVSLCVHSAFLSYT